MELYPVKFEIYEDDLPVATVEAFDESCANIKVTATTNATEWPKISEKIHEALKLMKLQGDE